MGGAEVAPGSNDGATSQAQGIFETSGDIELSIAHLRAAGFDVVDSIKAVRSILGVSLGEAKTVVHNSATWADAKKANEGFHEGLASHLEGEL
jgi:ribosomal protein L7/L12